MRLPEVIKHLLQVYCIIIWFLVKIINSLINVGQFAKDLTNVVMVLLYIGTCLQFKSREVIDEFVEWGKFLLEQFHLGVEVVQPERHLMIRIWHFL